MRATILLVALVVVAMAAGSAGQAAGHKTGHEHSHEHGHAHAHAHKDTAHAHSHAHAHTHKSSHAHAHEHAHAHGKASHAHAHTHAHAKTGHVDSRSRTDIWVQAIGCTVLVGLAPVLILFFVPVGRGVAGEAYLLRTLLGFAVGGLLGDVFLHLLPHALDPHDHSGGHHAHDDHDHFKGIVVGLWVLAGILAFFTIEKWVRSKAREHGGKGAHSHSHAHTDAAARHKKDDDAPADQLAGVAVSGWLNLAADFSHNFTDGLAIGASFLSSHRLGYITTMAVVIHEIPHEIGDFAILIRSGMSRRGAILAQVATALGCVGGTVVGLLAHQLAHTSAWILPFTSGGFIYIACTTVLPDLLHECSLQQSFKEIGAMVVGVAMMLGICFLE